MALIRTSAALPGGGSVILPGRPLRLRVRFQNQAAQNTMDVVFASGFTWKGLPPKATESEGGVGDLEHIQGAITINGTAGDVYDIEETVR